MGRPLAFLLFSLVCSEYILILLLHNHGVDHPEFTFDQGLPPVTPGERGGGVLSALPHLIFDLVHLLLQLQWVIRF